MKHALVLLSLYAAAGGAVASAQSAASPAVDRAAAIRAAQRTIDDEYARETMSPFTAIAVRYLEPGQTCRLGADGTGAAFDPVKPVDAAAEIGFDGGAFWVAPVQDSRQPVLIAKGAAGVGAASGTPVTARTKLGSGQVVGLGRFLAEALVSPGASNVRVFDPEAPAKKAFTGLKWFPPDPALQLTAAYAPNASPDKVIVMTSRGLMKEYYRAGTLSFTVAGEPMRLTALATTPAPKPGDELFVPFRDATTGAETYEVGRYLTVRVERAGEAHTLDFNLATNPLCNYSPHYNCPIPPKENVLPVAIRAGEMTYPSHR